VFFDLIHLARDLTGVCSAAIMQVPALIARHVDLNAGDSNQTEPVQGRDRHSPLVLVWLEGRKAGRDGRSKPRSTPATESRTTRRLRSAMLSTRRRGMCCRWPERRASHGDDTRWGPNRGITRGQVHGALCDGDARGRGAAISTLAALRSR
jgi:hypothetical protein